MKKRILWMIVCVFVLLLTVSCEEGGQPPKAVETTRWIEEEILPDRSPDANATGNADGDSAKESDPPAASAEGERETIELPQIPM